MQKIIKKMLKQQKSRLALFNTFNLPARHNNTINTISKYIIITRRNKGVYTVEGEGGINPLAPSFKFEPDEILNRNLT